MTHNRQMADSEGTFDQWYNARNRPCPRCDQFTIRYRVWESHCGGYEDLHYECTNCQYSWWIDGPDA